MSVTTTGSTKRLDIGKVLEDGLGALFNNFGPFFLLALLLQGIPSAVSAFGQLMSRSNAVFGIFTLGGVALLVTGPMLQAALIYGTMRTLDGHSISIADCMKVARKHWLMLLGLDILLGLSLAVGFLLLVLPGVLILLRWSVAAPLVVMEGRGIQEAMGRSATLTRDRRWSIFLLALIYLGVVLVIDVTLAVLGGGFSGLMRGGSALSIMLSPLISICGTLLSTPVITALFRQLRGDKEGAAPDALAEVFA